MAQGQGTGKKQNHDKSGAAARHQEEKRLAAEERQAAYAALTTEEKLARIAERPGSSTKEKARLMSGKAE